MSKVSVLVVDDATFIRDLVKKGLRNYFPGFIPRTRSMVARLRRCWAKRRST